MVSNTSGAVRDLSSRRMVQAGIVTSALAGCVSFGWLRRQPNMLGAFLRHPRAVGEVRRTAERTARLMVDSGLTNAPPGPVLSLGEGHGKPTLLVLLDGCGSRHVYSCEIDPILRAELLELVAHIPQVTVFSNALDAREILGEQTPAVILCYLPFTSLPQQFAKDLLRVLRDTIPEGEARKLVLIQYSTLSERRLRQLLGDRFTVQFFRGNFPPAWLYCFEVAGTRRLASRAG